MMSAIEIIPRGGILALSNNINKMNIDDLVTQNNRTSAIMVLA